MTLGRETKSAGLEPVLDARRVEHLWSGVVEHRRRRRLRSRVAIVACVLGAVTGATAFLLRAPPAAQPGIVAEKSAFRLHKEDGAEVLELADGSILRATQGARFSLERADAASVSVSLESGIIDVTARASAQRAFSVKTPLGMLATRDAQFDVEVSGAHMFVEVKAGEVELQRTGRPVERLRAGARWQIEEPVVAPPALVVSVAPSSSPPQLAAPRARADAARLLEQADSAQLARDPARAARLLDELRIRFPSDPNAALAAFEAGRIYLRRAEPARAVDALRFAVAHADAAFREDAEAGLAQALSDAGDGAGCGEARAAYLEHHPLGAHRARIGALCR